MDLSGSIPAPAPTEPATSSATDEPSTTPEPTTTSEQTSSTEPEPTSSTETSSEPEPTTTETPTTETTSDTPTSTTTSSATTTEPPSTTTTEPPSTTSETSETSETSQTSEPTSSTKSETETTATTATTATSTEPTTTTITITSTDTSTPTQTTGNAADKTTSTIGGSATASAADAGGGGGGLSAGGTIAVAVVVPVVSVAIIVLVALWLWRKHKAKKVAEEERRKEVEEYGFNPNNDPTLPSIMGGAAYDPNGDNTGYRGWGTTSAGRNAAGNMSGSAGVGLAMSEEGSQPGYHRASTPSEGTIQYSDGHGAIGETEPYGILGAAPVAAPSKSRNVDVHRGPSNASSAYSVANRSDASDESHMSATHPTGPYYGENPYYSDMADMQQPYGGYGDGPYGAGQPVIRDVQARRNTRIENPSVFPRQGNAGIAQNF